VTRCPPPSTERRGSRRKRSIFKVFPLREKISAVGVEFRVEDEARARVLPFPIDHPLADPEWEFQRRALTGLPADGGEVSRRRQGGGGTLFVFLDNLEDMRLLTGPFPAMCVSFSLSHTHTSGYREGFESHGIPGSLLFFLVSSGLWEYRKARATRQDMFSCSCPSLLPLLLSA
jgi:hypothetical protein